MFRLSFYQPFLLYSANASIFCIEQIQIQGNFTLPISTSWSNCHFALIRVIMSSVFELWLVISLGTENVKGGGGGGGGGEGVIGIKMVGAYHSIDQNET